MACVSLSHGRMKLALIRGWRHGRQGRARVANSPKKMTDKATPGVCSSVVCSRDHTCVCHEEYHEVC